MLKVNNEYTRTTLNDDVLVSLLLTLNKNVSIVDSEHVNVGWSSTQLIRKKYFEVLQQDLKPVQI